MFKPTSERGRLEFRSRPGGLPGSETQVHALWEPPETAGNTVLANVDLGRGTPRATVGAGGHHLQGLRAHLKSLLALCAPGHKKDTGQMATVPSAWAPEWNMAETQTQPEAPSPKWGHPS